MKALSLPLYYFTRNHIDNNMLKISETFSVIMVLLVFFSVLLGLSDLAEKQPDFPLS